MEGYSALLLEKLSTFSILDVNKRIQFWGEVGCYNPYSDEAMGLTLSDRRWY